MRSPFRALGSIGSHYFALQYSDQLQSLLRANSPPPPTLMFPFKASIASSDSDLARYDDEINTSREGLDELIAERQALQKCNEACPSPFAPVRRLPQEILVEIFELCRPSRVRMFDTLEPYPARADCRQRTAQSHLLTLSQVCWVWYKTVIGTPTLWATIETFLFVSPEHAISSLSRSLERSALCPLSIHIAAGPAPFTGDGLELLAPQSRRWHHADIYTEEAVAHRMLCVRNNLPLLQRLEIGGDIHQLRDIFEVAPRLTQLTLASDDNPPLLPWHQLQKVVYEGSDCYTGVFPFSILLHCPPKCAFVIQGLWVFELGVPSAIPAVPVVSDIQSLQWGLVDLKGSENSRRILGGVLARLTLRSLEALTLRSRESCSNAPPLLWPRDEFLPFASRSLFRRNLTKLCLHDMVITVDELVECLEETRSLKELYVQDVPSEAHVLITNDLLHRLTWIPGPACLIPHLASFRSASGHHFEEDSLLHFVESRLVSGRTKTGPLEVMMDWQREITMDDCVSVSLGELVDKGELILSKVQTLGLNRALSHGSKQLRLL
ncbi:hypothetical protein C8R47DRAFT_1108688 [Mycena vitilis]|nr:hypothetical protein C8R47DRAFT_1108688 [Mycena vitilis]